MKTKKTIPLSVLQIMSRDLKKRLADKHNVFINYLTLKFKIIIVFVLLKLKKVVSKSKYKEIRVVCNQNGKGINIMKYFTVI